MLVMFNTNPPREGNRIPEYSQDTIENTLNLRQVSLEDAARYGGPLTRAALGAMKFKGDRKNIIVDTKVHLLMDGMIPAIPGWHTDGVPRGDDLNPGGKGVPRISAQATWITNGITEPRYHLLVTGTHSQTEFIHSPMILDVEDSRDLYASMTKQVEAIRTKNPYTGIYTAPSNTVVEWDWFNIHRAVPARGRGWRFLIRVTETDYIEPRTDPADFIRTQNQVYLPVEFGW